MSQHSIIQTNAQGNFHGGQSQGHRNYKHMKANGLVFWKEVLRDRIRNFTPTWYTVTMGTGIIGSLLFNFPWKARWILILARMFFYTNIATFSIFSIATVLRYVIWPKSWIAMIKHHDQSLYLGCISMGFATLIIDTHLFWPEHWQVVYVMFWIDVVMTLIVGLALVLYMIMRPPNKLQRTTSILLFLFIPMIVTSAAGAVLINSLPTPHAEITLVVCFMLWSAGISISCAILTVYFWKLMMHDLPSNEAIVTTFLPIGPLGQGSFAIFTLCSAFGTMVNNPDNPLSRIPKSVSHANPASNAALALTIHWIGIIVALALLGFATFWACHAVIAVTFKPPKKFSSRLWGCVFPSGTYALGMSAVANELGSAVLKGIAAACTVIVICLWLVCTIWTAWEMLVKGYLFFVPEEEDDPDKAS